MEVLTAYVRQHTPWRPEEAQQDAAVQKKSEDSTGKSEPSEVPGFAADIQAIMTVIRRRTRSFDNGEPDFLHLHETNLSGADLFQANLSGAHLYKANHFKANLERAHLSIVWHLTQEQLEETTGDENTQLPPDLKPPAHWNGKTDEQIEGA